jgi:hypothetical protein
MSQGSSEEGTATLRSRSMSDHVLNIEADAEDRKEATRGGRNAYAKEIKVFPPNPLLTQRGRMDFEMGEVPGMYGAHGKTNPRHKHSIRP